ncbi:MAG: glycosyltransferase [Solirubrobacteraceae bacterium]
MDGVERSSSPLREAAGLGADSHTALILYQGGFAPNRGLWELVLAMHEIEGAMLVLMGWGRLEGELEVLIRDERLQDRVRILPPVHRDQLLVWTAGADVGAIPYQPIGLNNTYSTPNKLFEYMAAGVPIVATRLPEIARIVEAHAIGVTFAHVTPGEIAVAIRSVLADPVEHQRMRARAITVSGLYTWEQQAAKLVAVYEGFADARFDRD